MPNHVQDDEDIVDTCPIGQKCVRNFCLPNCNQDDQCSLGERCVENSCIKICFYDAHCLAGEFCEKSDQVGYISFNKNVVNGRNIIILDDNFDDTISMIFYSLTVLDQAEETMECVSQVVEGILIVPLDKFALTLVHLVELELKR